MIDTIQWTIENFPYWFTERIGQLIFGMGMIGVMLYGLYRLYIRVYPERDIHSGKAVLIRIAAITAVITIGLNIIDDIAR